MSTATTARLAPTSGRDRCQSAYDGSQSWACSTMPVREISTAPRAPNQTTASGTEPKESGSGIRLRLLKNTTANTPRRANQMICTMKMVTLVMKRTSTLLGEKSLGPCLELVKNRERPVEPGSQDIGMDRACEVNAQLQRRYKGIADTIV